jgi:hypothetical protein
VFELPEPFEVGRLQRAGMIPPHAWSPIVTSSPLTKVRLDGLVEINAELRREH